MNKPDRWLNDDDLPEGARDLLRAGRRPRPMTRAERSRSTARTARLLVIPMAAGTLLWVKGLALAAGLCAAGAVAYRVMATPHTPATASPTSEVVVTASSGSPVDAMPSAAPDEAAAIAEPRGAIDAPQASVDVPKAVPPLPHIETPVASSSVATDAPPASDTLTREVEMLEQARALLASRPGEALARLEQHAATFPRGKLGMEREFLIIDALHRLGRNTAARSRAEALLARSRGGLYEERVERMLKSMR